MRKISDLFVWAMHVIVGLILGAIFCYAYILTPRLGNNLEMAFAEKILLAGALAVICGAIFGYQGDRLFGNGSVWSGDRGFHHSEFTKIFSITMIIVGCIAATSAFVLIFF